MWRPLFYAIGMSLCLLGAEFLVIEKAIYAREGTMSLSNPAFVPPEWAPWSLLSTGAVVLLYSITLGRSGA